MPCRAARLDLVGEAPEILDEQDPEADGDCPELPDGQRLHRLVGADHSSQAFWVEPAVRVRDVRPREAEDARIPLQRTVGQLRELAVVVGRQVVPDLADLLVDDVEVVDQPFGGRRDRAFSLDGARQGPVRREQDPAVLRDPRSDRAPLTGRIGNGLGSGQALGVLLEPFHAEELRENRLVAPRRDAVARFQAAAGASSG